VSEQVPLSRGPRPWREPRTFDEWLLTLAWVQLGVLIGWSVLLGYLSLALSGLDDLGCIDGDERACQPSDSSPWFGAAELAASVLVYATAAAAIVLTRRRVRRGGSRAAVVATLALPALCAILAALLTEVPV
jgi:hypothetical protein